MSQKFRDRYRIPSARASWWDYGWNASYFITICTAHRECVLVIVETPNLGVSTITNLGVSINEQSMMILSEIGKIVQHHWFDIPNHFPNIKLGAFVVMPNHIHGIIEIDKSDNFPFSNLDFNVMLETPNLGVSTNPNLGGSTTPRTTTANASKIWKPGILGVIVNQYKCICTIQSRKIHPSFDWQSRYHDHIIRDCGEYQRISAYIANNPINWCRDKFHGR